MTNEVQKWRKVAFIHIDKKNAALKEVEFLRGYNIRLRKEQEDMELNYWIAIFAVWLWSVICVFLALKTTGKV
jgi:hypothetical protein